MTARQPEVLRRILESDRLDLHTALPGRVRSYDSDTQTADIELGVRRVIPVGDEDEEDRVEDYPILPSVPVVFPRGGGYFLHFPLEAGDGVLVIFAESDLNRWRETGDVSDPGVATRHGLSGAVALAGLHWRGDANAAANSNLRIGRETGPRIEITGSEIQAGGTVALAEAPDVRTHLQAIAAALDTIATAAGTTNSYVYATAILGAPIDTGTLKGT